VGASAFNIKQHAYDSMSKGGQSFAPKHPRGASGALIGVDNPPYLGSLPAEHGSTLQNTALSGFHNRQFSLNAVPSARLPGNLNVGNLNALSHTATSMLLEPPQPIGVHFEGVALQKRSGIKRLDKNKAMHMP